jgi:hypothetical protein
MPRSPRLGLLALLGLIAACDFRSAAEKRREILRARSPGGGVDAVVEYVTTDHLSADIQELYLVPARETPQYGNERRALYVSHLSRPLELRWRGDSVLEVAYDEAYIQGFSNVWYGPWRSDSTRIVELRLVSAGPRSLPARFGRR